MTERTEEKQSLCHWGWYLLSGKEQVGTCILVLSDSLAVEAKELWAFACGLTDPLYSFPHPGTTFEMQTWQAELEYLLLPFPVQLPPAPGLRVGTGRERRWEPGGRCGAGGDGDSQRTEEAAIPADSTVTQGQRSRTVCENTKKHGMKFLIACQRSWLRKL